jgi:hypothetical protein
MAAEFGDQAAIKFQTLREVMLPPATPQGKCLTHAHAQVLLVLLLRGSRSKSELARAVFTESLLKSAISQLADVGLLVVSEGAAMRLAIRLCVQEGRVA